MREGAGDAPFRKSRGDAMNCFCNIGVTVVLPVFQRSVPEFAKTWESVSSGRHENFCFDVHYYHCFEDEWNRMTLAEHLRAVQDHAEELQRFPMVVGEWSVALGGRGKAALPASQAMALFGRQQLKAYAEASHGWFFWNWRDGAGIAWDYRICFQQQLFAGVAPSLLNASIISYTRDVVAYSQKKTPTRFAFDLMARADGMTEGVEMAGEIKKQKQKKNKMNVENDGFGFSEEAFETREENWSVKEPFFESPPPAPAPPVVPPPTFMEEVEEVEAESPEREQPESFEFRDAAANRFARAKDGPSTWTPSLGWKGASNKGPETGKSSWSTQAHQAGPSWGLSWFFHENRHGYQGTASTDANATAPTSGTSAWANWKSNNNGNNEWWERPSRRETSEEFADAVKVTKEGLMVILLRNRGLDEEGIRRFCNWLPGFMRKQRLEETQLVQRGDCFLAKELDASKNYLNAAALKMLLTVLKEQRIVLGVLNLHHNKLDGAAASMLGMWIKTCPLALYELHLSHNEIDTEGALEIIQEVAMSD
eukprot:symbB.v1.2.013910.t1/scaffold935.1/size150374/7